jgi:hypothetical protein
MTVRLSACISAATTGRICVKFDIGTSLKIYRGTPNLIKARQNYLALYMKTQIVLLLPATFNRHKSALFG